MNGAQKQTPKLFFAAGLTASYSPPSGALRRDDETWTRRTRRLSTRGRPRASTNASRTRGACSRAPPRAPRPIVQASSLGAEDQVLTDLIARDRLPIAVATLDTGMLHGETLVLIDDIRERYDIRIERYRPVHEAVIAFVAATARTRCGRASS